MDLMPSTPSRRYKLLYVIRITVPIPDSSGTGNVSARRFPWIDLH